MWVLTTTGFYSCVATPAGEAMVRGRVPDDLSALAARLPTRPEVLETLHADYPYRVIVPMADWAEFLREEGAAVDYPNFKAAVDERQGVARHAIYSSAWAVFRRLENLWNHPGEDAWDLPVDA